MYADHGIQFRDPFVSSNAFFDHPPKAGWLSKQQQRHPNLSPPLTPAPEMNAASYPPKSSSHHQDGDYQNGSYASAQQPWRASAASYHTHDLSNSEYGRNSTHTAYSSRPFSPVSQQQRQSSVDEGQQQALQKRGSIALSFQIPKSVNDSGGSLAELAAQVGLKVECSYGECED